MIPSLLSGSLGLLVSFASLARGAHDLWSASLVHLAALILFGFYLIYLWKTQTKPSIQLPFLPQSLLVILVFSVSAFFSYLPSDAFFSLKDLLVFFLVYFLAANLFQSPARILIFLKVAAFGLCLQVVFLLFPIQGPRFPWRDILFHTDLPGTMINANVLAGFALFWIPVYWNLWRKQKDSSRWAWSLGFFSSLLLLFFSKSVAATACLAILFSATVSSDSRKKVFWLLILGVVLLLGYKLFFAPWSQNPSMRLLWWKTALAMWIDNPWLGVGPGNFSSAFLAYKSGIGQNTLSAHSFPLQLLSETGLCGVLSVGVFSFFVARNIKRTFSTSSTHAPFLWGLILFLLFSFTSLGQEYLVNLLVMGLFLGIALSSMPLRPYPVRLTGVLLFVAAFFTAFIFIVSTWMASRSFISGYAELEVKNMNQAEKYFIEATQLDSLTWEAYQGQAFVSYLRYLSSTDANDLEKAILFQEKATAYNKLNGWLWYELASYYQLAGREEESIESLIKAERFHYKSTPVKRTNLVAS